jgi:hypothetical protein
MLSNRKRVLIAAVAVVALAGTATGVYASVRGANHDGTAAGTATASPNGSISITNCRTPKVDFVTNDSTGLSTASTSYVAVPGMSKTITIPGSVTTCVVVHVAAFSFAPGSGNLVLVSVGLDGTSANCNPSETQFSGQDVTFAQAHAYLCAFPSVAPGSHTVTMLFRSLSGSTVFMHRPSMSIEHK